MADVTVYGRVEYGTWKTSAPSPHVDLAGTKPGGYAIEALFVDAMSNGEKCTVTVRYDRSNWAVYAGAEFATGSPNSFDLSGATLVDSSGTFSNEQTVEVIGIGPAYLDRVVWPSGWYPDALTASQIVLHAVIPVGMTLPASLTDSVGYSDTLATADSEFSIQKNGVEVGTMTFGSGGATPTFVMASATSFAAGDRLKVVAPASPDATLAGISFTIAGVRDVG